MRWRLTFKMESLLIFLRVRLMKSAHLSLLLGMFSVWSALLVLANFGAGGLRRRRGRLAPKWPSPRAASGVVEAVLGTRFVKHVFVNMFPRTKVVTQHLFFLFFLAQVILLYSRASLK